MTYFFSLLCAVVLVGSWNSYNGYVEGGNFLSTHIGKSFPTRNYYNQRCQQQLPSSSPYNSFRSSLIIDNNDSVPRKYRRRGKTFLNRNRSSRRRVLHVDVKRIESDARDGAAAARQVVRTMSARRMETLK